MFEKASRMKLRFVYKGTCSVEDLWDLPLAALDKIFKALNTELKAAQEESLLESKSVKDTELELRVVLIKHVVAVRLAEQKIRESAQVRSEQKKKLLDLIAEKQDESLKGKSLEELQAMVNQL